MLWFIIKGGPVMAPIILGSILGLAIIIEKLRMFRAIKIDTEGFAKTVLSHVKEKKFKDAIDLCQAQGKSPLAATLKAGIEKRALPAGELERVMERVGNAQVNRLEKYLGGLVSIIGIEPLLGFLGTITGLIRAFMTWEKAGANITVSALASGIYEAMITTAAGLIIAVPYYLACNYFVSKIKYISYEMNDYSAQLVEVLSEMKSKA